MNRRIIFVATALLGLIVAASVEATTIYDVQYTTDPGDDSTYPSPLLGDVVTLTGVVTAVRSGQFPNFWLQDADLLWSGVFFFNSNIGPEVGDSLTATSQVDEYYGMTEMKNVSAYTIHKHGCPYDTLDIHTGSLGTERSFHGERFEGCLVRVCNVRVTREPDLYNQWYVDDGSGECQIDDYCYPIEYDPSWEDTVLCITGVVDYSFYEFGINPRSLDDIALGTCTCNYPPHVPSPPENAGLPAAFSLAQNFPNPFNPITEIRYSLPVDCRVKLEIYDLLGRRVATLVDENQAAGYKTIRWNSRGVNGGEISSGIYFYSIQAGDFAETGKMVLIK